VIQRPVHCVKRSRSFDVRPFGDQGPFFGLWRGSQGGGGAGPHISLHIAVYHYISLYVGIYGYISLYMAIYGNISLYKLQTQLKTA
jgi:hypothetical protein